MLEALFPRARPAIAADFARMVDRKKVAQRLLDMAVMLDPERPAVKQRLQARRPDDKADVVWPSGPRKRTPQRRTERVRGFPAKSACAAREEVLRS